MAICPYTPGIGPWYWSVQNASPGTQVWSSAAGAYVALADATYVAWLAAGCVPTSIDTDTNLWAVLNSIAFQLHQSGSGYSHQILTLNNNATLTNPLPTYTFIDMQSVGKSVTLPQGNLLNSIPIGVQFRIENIGLTTQDSFVLKYSDGTTIDTIYPNEVFILTARGDSFSVATGSYNINLSFDPSNPSGIASLGRLIPRQVSPARFFATKGGTNQTGIADSTATQVTFGTENYDIGGYFASSAWTPPAGPVEMSAAVIVTGTWIAGKDFAIYIYKNGSVLRQSSTPTAVNAGGVSITIEDEANGTDVYTVYVYVDTDAGTATVLGGTTFSYFCGHSYK